jgi:hypothetical protein
MCHEVFVTGTRVPELYCSGSKQREDTTTEDQLELERLQRHQFDGGAGN